MSGLPVAGVDCDRMRVVGTAISTALVQSG